MRKQDFDCVEMKHTVVRKLQSEIRGVKREQDFAYWAEGTRKMREEKERLHRKDRSAAP